MAENTELKESVDLMSSLRKQAQELAKGSDARKTILKDIDNIEKSISKEIKTQTVDQKKLRDLYDEVYEKAKEISEEYEELNRGNADSMERLVELHRELGEKLIQRESLTKKIAAREDFTVNVVNSLNKLGLERSVSLYKEFIDLVEKGNKGFAVANLLIVGLRGLLNFFDKLDSAAADFRIQMGLTRGVTEGIEKNARTTYFQLAQIGIKIDDIYKSFQAVAASLGSAYFTTKDMAADMALLSTQLGVAQANSAEFARVMAMMAKSTLDAQKDLTLFTSKLSEAAGTNLNEVMADVASASRSSYQFLSRNPLVLAKSAVEAKRMGTSLADAAKSADSLIRFTSSVESEMEASVLLGNAINLQRARELAYRKDLAGVNREILNLAKQSRFEELDPFQQEAVAKALGKSADELGRMLQSEREIAKMRSDPSLRKQVEAYDELTRATERVAKLTAQDQRLQLSRLSNQKAITAITSAWSAIWQRLIEGPVTVLAKVLPWIAEQLGKINTTTRSWAAAAAFVAAGVGLIIGAKGLGKLVAWASGGIGKSISNIFGGVANGVKTFGSPAVLKGAAGMLLVALSLIPLALALKIATGVPWKTVAIMGVSLVGIAAIAAIIGAPPIAALAEVGALVLITLGAAALIFAGAAYIFSRAIKSLDGVNIPKIALGIASLGIAITPLALVAPLLPVISLGLTMFSVALRLTAGPAERMGKAAEMLGQGLQTAVSSIASLKSIDLFGTLKQLRSLSVIIDNVSRSVNAIPDIKVEKLQSIVVKTAEVGATEESKNTEEILKALDSIRSSVDALRSSMERGGINANVTIDSQRLDSAASRRLSFTGPLTPQPVSF